MSPFKTKKSPLNYSKAVHSAVPLRFITCVSFIADKTGVISTCSRAHFRLGGYASFTKLDTHL